MFLVDGPAGFLNGFPADVHDGRVLCGFMDIGVSLEKPQIAKCGMSRVMDIKLCAADSGLADPQVPAS